MHTKIGVDEERMIEEAERGGREGRDREEGSDDSTLSAQQSTWAEDGT